LHAWNLPVGVDRHHTELGGRVARLHNEAQASRPHVVLMRQRVVLDRDAHVVRAGHQHEPSDPQVDEAASLDLVGHLVRFTCVRARNLEAVEPLDRQAEDRPRDRLMGLEVQPQDDPVAGVDGVPGLTVEPEDLDPRETHFTRAPPGRGPIAVGFFAAARKDVADVGVDHLGRRTDLP
jgi:hypothetical protein